MKKLFVIFFLCQLSPFLWRGAGGEVNAQDQYLIDSLQLQLKNHNTYKLELGKNAPALYDTAKAKILIQLSYVYSDYNKGKATEYAKQSLAISEEMNYKKGIAKALSQLGLILQEKNNYVEALELHRKSLLIKEEIGDENGIAASFNNIGNIYLSQDNYPEALKYYFNALRLNEKTGNKEWQSFNLCNMSDIYVKQGNYSEALSKMIAAGKLVDASGDMFLFPVYYLSIGVVYEKQGNTKEALINYFKYAEACRKMNYPVGEALASNHIGKVHLQQGNYVMALQLFLSTLEILKQNENDLDIAETYLNIGNAYYKQNNYDDAKRYLNLTVNLSKQIGSIGLIMQSYESLSDLEKSKGNFADALSYFKITISYRDSIVNSENSKKSLGLQLQYDTEKKEKQIALLNTDKKIQEKEISKKKTERNGFVAGCILLLMIGGVAYNRYQVKQKTNKELSDALMQLKQVQEKLIEQEKLASLGQLTAGIAHEIQNPLNFVINFSELSRELFDDLNDSNPEVRTDAIKDLEDNLSKIEKHGLRADGIIQSMLLHSKTGDYQKQLTNLNTLCKEAIAFSWQAVTMSNPEFKCKQQLNFDETIPEVKMMQQDISSVIINLLNNAFYAMNEKKESSLTSSTYEPELKMQSILIDGKVHLKVSDNGNGIPQEVRNKIFQPFFTTKPTHLGTGLGLSISYDIVKAHGGNLAIESTTSNGTVFVLSLPA